MTDQDMTSEAMTAGGAFRVALTGDFYDDRGELRYRDVGLNLFQEAGGFVVERFAEHRAEVAAEQLSGCHAAVVLAPRVTRASLASADRLLALARFGVGYDSVDVNACTEADVALTIAVGAVDHSVAEATVGWMLALSHRLRDKDRLVREGGWDRRSRYMGFELRDRTLGVIGFGGIGRAVVRMLSGFRMQPPLVFDPFVPADEIAAAGGRSATLDELLAGSDFVSLHCPLNDRTRGLLGPRELGLLKPGACLINTARGGIVDEDALFEGLVRGRIGGAALDCFQDEPLSGVPRWAALDNVLLAPHAIAWTDELFRDIGRAACRSVIELRDGRRPRGVVNPEVFERPSFQAKWRRLRESFGGRA